MNITIKIASDEVGPHLDALSAALANGLNEPLVAAADTFITITKENIGETGKDRPSEWEPLSKRYAKRVKRPYATLEVSGTLKNSIKRGEPSNGSIEVSSDVPYASSHQHGVMDKNLPDRPYFPDSSIEQQYEASLTPNAEAAIEAAIVAELEKIFNG